MCSRRSQADSSAKRFDDKQGTHVDLGNRLLHDLLASIVDQNIKSSMFSDMLRYQLFTVLGVHNIESEGHTFLAVLLDSLFDSLGTDRQLNSTRYMRQLTLPPPQVDSRW